MSVSAVDVTRLERDQLILSLRAEGKSLAAIGQQVGLSGTRVGRILGGVRTPLNPEGLATVRTTRAATTHRCATPGCGAVLRNERWIYSSHTGVRYCYVGEGCWTWSEKKRKAMREANVAPKPELVA